MAFASTCHAASLVTVVDVGAGGEGVSSVSGSGPGRKRIPLNRKTHAHLPGISGTHSRPRVWKRLRHVGHFVGALVGDKRRRLDQRDGDFVLGHPQDRGWLMLGAAQAHVLRPARCLVASARAMWSVHTHTFFGFPNQQQQHQATGFTGRLFFFVLTSLVLVCGRTLMLHTLREQRGDAASAGCGRTGGMSSSRCKCSWPRTNTRPPHGDRAGPGAGGGNEQYYTATCRSIPPPRRQALSTFPWTSKMCLPPGRGLTASLTVPALPILDVPCR